MTRHIFGTHTHIHRRIEKLENDFGIVVNVISLSLKLGLRCLSEREMNQRANRKADEPCTLHTDIMPHGNTHTHAEKITCQYRKLTGTTRKWIDAYVCVSYLVERCKNRMRHGVGSHLREESWQVNHSAGNERDKRRYAIS